MYCHPQFKDSEFLGVKCQNLFDKELNTYLSCMPELTDFYMYTYLNPENYRFTVNIESFNRNPFEYVKVEFLPAVVLGQNPIHYDSRTRQYYADLHTLYQDFKINDESNSKFFHSVIHYIGSMLDSKKTFFNEICLGKENLPDEERGLVKQMYEMLKTQSNTLRLMKYVENPSFDLMLSKQQKLMNMFMIPEEKRESIAA